MKFQLDGRTYCGHTVDLSGTDIGQESVCDALGLDPDDPLAVVTEEPPSHRRALARAARTRGHVAPQDDRIDDIQQQLADRHPPDAPNLAAARERAAEAAANVERLREKVATARGRLQATKNGEGDVTELENEHRTSIRELTVSETESVAAEQALATAIERAHDRRMVRRRTLQLRDELTNRQHEARQALTKRVYPEFTAAVERLPGEAHPGTVASEFVGDAVVGHLGAVAIADRDAPVVLTIDRFGGVAEAATRLGVPVVQV